MIGTVPLLTHLSFHQITLYLSAMSHLETIGRKYTRFGADDEAEDTTSHKRIRRKVFLVVYCLTAINASSELRSVLYYCDAMERK